MAQEKMKINGKEIRQPDKGLGYSFETTHSSDSGRVQSGIAHVTALFTVESFSYTATGLKEKEMSEILREIARSQIFTLHYRSPYYGAWRDDKFYAGKGTISIGSWKEDEELYESLSFNMIGVNPL